MVKRDGLLWLLNEVCLRQIGIFSPRLFAFLKMRCFSSCWNKRHPFHQMISDDDWYNTLWELTCVPPRNTINPGICVEKRLDIARPESPRYGPNRSGISLWANGVCKYTIYQHTVWKPLVFTPNAVETQDTRKFIYASIHWNLLLL